ncbi:phosphatidylglycerol lysyltransferase domain-containing protein [Embleya sp. NPDC020630]|uniref:phosphatidylglycerol lysyltransferase domain-containing protein n=1 Tax=Embleya sp. NPDC020630 TaxID=3363979 RepID=UPI00379A448D
MSATTRAAANGHNKNGTGTPAAERVRGISAGVLIWYLRIVAALDFVSAVSVPLRDRVRHHDTGEYYTPFLVTSGFTSAALAAFLAIMLSRRKRAAWAFTAILLVPSTAVYIWALWFDDLRQHPFNWFSTILTFLICVALLLSFAEFGAKGDRGNVLKAGLVLAGGAVVGVVLGSTLVNATDDIADSSMSDRILYAVLRIFTLAPDSDLGSVAVPRWVDIVINVAGVTLFLLVLYVLFRAPKGRELLTPDDEVLLRELLDKQGERDSLGYFALRRDKAVMWSPSGKAAVAYRVVGGVSLASGDPIGDPEAWPGAIDRWLAEAEDRAWVPAVMGASEEAGTIFARHGLDALELGDEAIVEVSEFSLEGRAMRGVRQAYNRVKRAGYTTRVRRHEDIPEGEMRELLDLADHWRDGQTERGFSMALGRLGDPDDGRCLMVECMDGEGRLRAVLSFVPWGAKGVSLDLMRRDRESDNGLIEFMVLDVIEGAKAYAAANAKPAKGGKGKGKPAEPEAEAPAEASSPIDIERISLNFAMFRSVFERGNKLGAGPVLRLWRAVLVFFSRWWQIESLYRANEKYRPIWEPRYICFRKASELPRIGIASARAEGFLTTPTLPQLFGARHEQRVASMTKRKAAEATPPLDGWTAEQREPAEHKQP